MKMDNNIFVEGVIEGIADYVQYEMTEGLKEVHGRNPRKKHVQHSEWYKGLKESEKEIHKSLTKETIDATLFYVMTLLDGVSELGEDYYGNFELKYTDEEGKSYLINNPEEEYLHDIYNAIRNPED